MAERSDLSRRFLLGLIVAGLLAIQNCHIILPFKTVAGPVGRTYVCKATMKEYGRKYEEADPAVQLTIHGVGPVTQVPFYNSDSAVVPALYANDPWKPTARGLPWQLKGTRLVQVSNANADSPDDPFLAIRHHRFGHRGPHRPR